MASPKTSMVPRGNETVLLVEPEPEVRVLAAFMLTRQGYRVLEAHNAMEALKIYDEQEGAIDLLFVEALMSRINGHELANALLGRDPRLRVLFLADSDYERTARRAAAQKGIVFLHRPFTMAALAGRVRQVLDAPKPAQATAAAGSSR